MRAIRRSFLAVASAGLLVLGLTPAVPAYASGKVAVSVLSDSYYQFFKTCGSASECNTVSGTQLDFFFELSRELSTPITIHYKVVNGTAVDGVDFNTPTPGSITIPANTGEADLQVPLVNEGEFGTTKTFTIDLTSASQSASLGGPATGTIYGGNVATDCNFTYLGSESLSLTCSARPPTQSWFLRFWCVSSKGIQSINSGNNVTGDGKSTASCSSGITSGEGFLIINS